MQQIHLPQPVVLPLDQNREHQADESGVGRDGLDRLVQAGIATSHPSVVSGAFVFAGTRVPLYNLWDYLAAGDSIEDFLESFPTVPRTLVERAVVLVGERFKGGACCS